MDWLTELKRQATSRLNGRIYYGASGNAQLNRDLTEAYRSTATTAAAGTAPRRTDYLRVGVARNQPSAPASSPGMFERIGTGSGATPAAAPDFSFDADAYNSAMFAWMRGNEHYSEWSDEDLQTFLRDTAEMTDSERAAQELYKSSQIGYDKAKAQAAADRQQMLGELATFKAGFGDDWINGQISRETAAWDAKINSTVDRTVQEMANLGRKASPYMLAAIRRTMVAQKQDALQVRRFELEAKKSEMTQAYLSMLNNVLSNTQVQTQDPAQVLQMITSLGRSNSQVRPVAA